MLNRYYKMDLLSQSIRRGAWSQAIGLTGRMARALLQRQRQVVFMLSDTDALRVPRIDISGYAIEPLAGWPAVWKTLYQPQPDFVRHLPDDPETFCRQGAVFWVGRLDGQIATVGVSRRESPPDRFFFPIPPGHVLLSHFVTLPAYRGRGLYPAMLVRIVHSLAIRGVAGFVIDCADWNVASRRGIERAGFQLIGTGAIKRGGRMAWYPLPSVPIPVVEGCPGS